MVAELAEDAHGASGAVLDLPRLSEALEMARAGQFDVLIARELDRLSRSFAKQSIVERELKLAGVSIEYVLHDLSGRPEGLFDKNLLAMLAEYERDMIRQRMMRGRPRKAEAGEVMNHGRPLFGYRNVVCGGRNTLEIREDEAKTVRLIFALYTQGYGAHGPMSIRSIAKYLTEHRVPSYSDLRRVGGAVEKLEGRRGHWSVSSVGRILSNETYAGTWHYGTDNGLRDPIAVDVPAIVDRQTWVRAQELRKLNSRNIRPRRKHNYLLTGYLTCAACGRRMVGSSKRSRGGGKLNLYYSCYSKTNGYECATGYISFPASQVDAIAWKWLHGLTLDQVHLEKSLRQQQAERRALSAAAQARIEAIDDLIAERQKRLDRLLEVYLAADFDIEALSKAKVREEAELTALTDERKKLQNRRASERLTEEWLQSALDCAAAQEGVAEADVRFEDRRRLLEIMELTGEAAVEGGKKVVDFHCIAGYLRMEIASDGTTTTLEMAESATLDSSSRVTEVTR